MKILNNIIIIITTSDVNDSEDRYEAISVIEFQGTLSFTGQSEGHYTCNVKDSSSSKWFKTNDGCDPLQVSTSEVSKCGYVVLFKQA